MRDVGLSSPSGPPSEVLVVILPPFIPTTSLDGTSTVVIWVSTILSPSPIDQMIDFPDDVDICWGGLGVQQKNVCQRGTHNLARLLDHVN